MPAGLQQLLGCCTQGSPDHASSHAPSNGPVGCLPHQILEHTLNFLLFTRAVCLLVQLLVVQPALVAPAATSAPVVDPSSAAAASSAAAGNGTTTSTGAVGSGSAADSAGASGNSGI